MLVISEDTFARRHCYRVICTNDKNQVISERIVRYPLVLRTAEHKIVLYDDRMQVILPAFKYLNHTLADQSYNSRIMAAHALRLLYCFSDIYSVDVQHLTIDDVHLLQAFLLSPVTDKNILLEEKTFRSAKTVNQYLNACRQYLKFLGFEQNYLFDYRIRTNRYNENEALHPSKAYRSTLKTPSPTATVPKYLTVGEFANLIKTIRQHGTLADECIARLMFECGLRRGEVLGLTHEDLDEILIGDEYYPVVYIRNRASDNPLFQSAKSCLVVENPALYDSPDYNTENLGYEKVFLSRHLYDLLSIYIDYVIFKILPKYPENYGSTTADATNLKRRKLIQKARGNPRALENLQNHYLFVNKFGRLLTGQTFNKRLRKYFVLSGLSVDNDSRTNNLAHRLRHSYAMFLIQHQHLDLGEVKQLMRHKSITSTMIYFNPTDEDIVREKTGHQQSLSELIPILQETPWLQNL